MRLKTALSKPQKPGRARAARATALLLLALLLTAAFPGCGEMNQEEYSNAAWEINRDFGDEATSLFAQLGKEEVGAELKEDAIQGLEAAQQLQRVFSSSLGELEKLKPPGGLQALHTELLDFYREGQALMEDFAAAYDHLYNVSSVLDGFFNQGMEIFKVGVLEGPEANLLAAIDKDIARVEACISALEDEASGGEMAAFDDFFIQFFSGLRDILQKEKAAILAGDAGARARLNSELTEHFSTFLQSNSGELPGFDELVDRLLLLNEEFHQLNSEINNL
jgi:hypothetical protein